MTFYHGLGMFFLGMGAIILIKKWCYYIAYFIINKVMEEEKKNQINTRFDDL